MDQEWEYREKLYYLRSWCLRTRIIPDASGIHQLSLKFLIFILLIFSLSSDHNRKTLLNFPMSLMPDQRQSVGYSANYFIFIVFGLFFLLIYVCANFPEKDNKLIAEQGSLLQALWIQVYRRNLNAATEHISVSDGVRTSSSLWGTVWDINCIRCIGHASFEFSRKRKITLDTAENRYKISQSVFQSCMSSWTDCTLTTPHTKIGRNVIDQLFESGRTIRSPDMKISFVRGDLLIVISHIIGTY